MDRVHVICVGFGKCGTSLLDQVVRRSTDFIHTKEIKEINYLNKPDANYPAYLNHFDFDQSKDQATEVFFEASPPYVTGPSREEVQRTFLRIKSTIPNAKILFCLRDPVYRAYSHYSFDLQVFAMFGANHYARNAMTRRNLCVRPYSHSFYNSMFSDRNPPTRYAPSVALAMEIFGKANVEFFFLEVDTPRHSGFHERFEHFIGVPDSFSSELVKEKLEEKILEGVALPSCHSGSQFVKAFFPAHYQPDLKENQLFIVNGHHQSVLVNDLEEDCLRRIMLASLNWSAEVSAQAFNLLHKTFFEQDLLQLHELIKDRPYADRIGKYLGEKTKGKKIPSTAYDPARLKSAIIL